MAKTLSNVLAKNTGANSRAAEGAMGSIRRGLAAQQMANRTGANPVRNVAKKSMGRPFISFDAKASPSYSEYMSEKTPITKETLMRNAITNLLAAFGMEEKRPPFGIPTRPTKTKKHGMEPTPGVTY